MEMSIDTPLTALLGIRRPILLAPMDLVCGARPTAARNNVWPAPSTGRCLINDHARRWTGRELELLQNVGVVAVEYAAARAAGNFDIAAVIAGEAVGLIHDIPPAAEIVDRIVTEADQILLGWRNSATALRA